MITLSEQNRRMQEMMKMYGMSGMDMGTENNPDPECQPSTGKIRGE